MLGVILHIDEKVEAEARMKLFDFEKNNIEVIFYKATLQRNSSR